MVIQKQLERSVWTNAALNFIPDIAIGVIAAQITDSGWVGFFVTLIGLQALYFLLWVKTSCWMWIHFWFTRKKLTEHLENYLFQNRYPRPQQFLNDTTDYFNQIAEAEQLPCALRIKAAVELGVMQGMKTAGRYQRLMQLNIAYDSALQLYARRFGPPPPPE